MAFVFLVLLTRYYLRFHAKKNVNSSIPTRRTDKYQTTGSVADSIRKNDPRQSVRTVENRQNAFINIS